ncbi:hypothetical protein FRC04_001712 [Tulasnella sp. 424]|nr:hypothetical protein FRC04_001712 [Tulasnella sp. 424]
MDAKDKHNYANVDKNSADRGSQTLRILRAELSRNKAEDNLSVLRGKARRRFLRGLAPAVDLALMDLACTSSSRSDDDTSESDSDTDSEVESESSNSGPKLKSASHLVTEERFACPQIATDGQQPGTLLQRLPGEVLHDIILKAQDSDPHIQFTFSHVSQYFRTLVITSPLLWCKLDLLYPLSLVSLYLERSGGVTLEVVVEQGSTPWRWPMLATRDHTKVEAFYEILRPHTHRIRRLRVQAPNSQFSVPEGQDIAHTQSSDDVADHFPWSSMLSYIEYLDLGFGTWDLGHSPNLPVAANLRELRLFGPWTPSVAFLVPPSLKHLTLGDHQRLSLDIIKEILASTAALETLTFSDVILVEPRVENSDIPDQPVQITSLNSLSITRCPGTSAKQIVQSIVCANLENLCIHFTGEDARSSSIHRQFYGIDVTFLTLYNTPHFQIRKLDLVSCDGEPKFLEAILDNLPCLRELRIASAALTHNHLKVLVITSTTRGAISQPIRCSQLISLTLYNEPAIGSNIIRHIARSRKEASIPLRSVTLRGFDLHNIFLEDLECIRESGVVDLTVTGFREEDAGSESEKDPDWSSSWSTDEELEDEIASGDEELLADQAHH